MREKKKFFLTVEGQLVKCIRTGGIREPPSGNQHSYS